MCTCPWSQAPCVAVSLPLHACPSVSSLFTMTPATPSTYPAPCRSGLVCGWMWTIQGSAGLRILAATFPLALFFTNRLRKELESKVQGCDLWQEYEVQYFIQNNALMSTWQRCSICPLVRALAFQVLHNHKLAFLYLSNMIFYSSPQRNYLLWPNLFPTTILIIKCKSFTYLIAVSSPTSFFYQHPKDFHPELQYTPC